METRQYRVEVTYNGERLVFRVTASGGPQAVKEARQLAKKHGMQRIMVNLVQPIEMVTFKYEADYAPPLLTLGGTATSFEATNAHAVDEDLTAETTLSADDVRRIIKHVWERMVVFVPKPHEPPLIAYELDGRVYLDDGISGRLELIAPTQIETVMLLYDWATYAGYCSEDYDEFIQQCWT